MTSGENIDVPRLPSTSALRFRDQLLDYARDSLCPAVLKRVLEIRCRYIDQFDFGEFRMTRPDQPDKTLDVVTLRFGDASGADADDGRLRSLDDIEDSLLDVLKASEDGCDFAHRGCLQRDRFAKMADEKHEAE